MWAPTFHHDAREVIAACLADYNTNGPHSALGSLTLMEYEAQLRRTSTRGLKAGARSS